jgi:hypothetical protein
MEAAIDHEYQEEDIQRLKLQAEQGDVEAQCDLGIMYCLGQGIQQDHTDAAKWFRLAAEQGLAEAQHDLGVMYRNGQGVQQDHTDAAKWFRLAAEQGLADAQNNLGLMYNDGQGVQQDHREADKWYRMAAKQGNDMALFNLGLMYKTEFLMDPVVALGWFLLAAMRGSDEGKRKCEAMVKEMPSYQIAESRSLAEMWVDREWKSTK